MVFKAFQTQMKTRLTISCYEPEFQQREKKMKVLAALLVLVAAVSAGNVDYDRCGGIGTITGLRISNCEGRVCNMDPGTPYQCEADLLPSQAIPSLSLKVTIIYMGFPINIIDTELGNSSVQPGQTYTIVFTITPNDQLSGEYFPIEASILHTNGGTVEICAGFHVRINELN